ncbi:N-acetyl-gamma-glutamyl-phosphate reductase [Aquisediminimonas profunda]|uniref:N-acetyl-gamma-glutamyl-phosphate reductase n=1 Tax=Aquisediminimonas profunda TaxID=1550733 RepID=UPI001C6382E5|nr:N-acetyl-gamma-glutamyl-phosphate reductase [Aquisediminimonas profunda]
MTSIFIDGGHGTTGLEIRQRLAGRKDIDLLELDETVRKEPESRREALNDADIVVLCLPDEAAREAVGLINNSRTRIIDASTAFRTAPDWTFGFHEIDDLGIESLRSAKRVSNPGCYSTGFLALVKPLVNAGLIPADWPLTVNAVSGYSGGGKAMIAEFESGGPPTAWRTYALGLAHKHVPEMQRHAGLVHAPLFAPSVAQTYRGMIVDVPLQAALIPGRPTPEAIRTVLSEHYTGSPIVSVVSDFTEADLTIEQAANTDRLELFVFANSSGSQVRLVAALDNLGKGAAGAAVQTLNIMSDLAETAGLRL